MKLPPHFKVEHGLRKTAALFAVPLNAIDLPKFILLTRKMNHP
jgi:hypothetical protein